MYLYSCGDVLAVLPSIMKMHGPKNKIGHILIVKNCHLLNSQ